MHIARHICYFTTNDFEVMVVFLKIIFAGVSSCIMIDTIIRL